MKSTKKFLWLALLLIASIWIITSKRNAPYHTISGIIFGTDYNITYQYNGELKSEVDSVLHLFDQSLNPFNDKSVIARLNRGENIAADTYFTTCFNKAMEVSKETNGDFDITVAPLVNVWGFGFKKNKFPDKSTIDSLKQFVGYQKVKLVNGRLVKSDPRVMIDCSAIAKGYAVDVVAQYLENKGISNFMIEIGGEIVAKGKNSHNDLWRIGINKPIDDSLSIDQQIQTVLQLTDVGLATSGNYRNFYYKNGKKYAHTINPHTGYPIQHNILSSTVIAKDCMTADAYATSFMVMGLEKAEAFCNAHPDIDACFIYSDTKGNFRNYYTKGMKKYLKLADK